MEYEYREVKSLTSIMWLIDETEEGDDVGTQGNVQRAEGGGKEQDRGLEGGEGLYSLANALSHCARLGLLRGKGK